jgi:arylsulfatase A-like enzyme
MKKLIRTTLATLCLSFTAQAAVERPNVIFVLFDDLGYSQPQCYDPQSALRTPNLDRLATQGMRFTDAHSASAVCTPTRYGVLTGRYPFRIGQFGVMTTFGKPIIPPERLTVASFLKQQGYRTACVGKWHLGMEWAGAIDKRSGEKTVPLGTKISRGPNALGFDYFCGYTHAGGIGTILEQDTVVAHVPPVENQPLMLKKAVEWIDQQKAGEPFFLYYPLGIPHEPIVPSAEFTGKSGARDVVRNNQKYGDWLYEGDAFLGMLLDALERKHLAENTLIIATSDNGAEHRAYPPLRDSKRSIYEGGHRVPFLARWPGKISPGATWNHPVCLNDFLATVAEICGSPLPPNAGEDSTSLLPALLGRIKRPTREATVHQSMSGELAIRKGPWKLVMRGGGVRELYDLDNDLGEKTDVIASQPKIAEELSALMKRYIAEGRSTAGPAQRNKVSPVIDRLQTGAADQRDQ